MSFLMEIRQFLGTFNVCVYVFVNKTYTHVPICAVFLSRGFATNSSMIVYQYFIIITKVKKVWNLDIMYFLWLFW